MKYQLNNIMMGQVRILKCLNVFLIQIVGWAKQITENRNSVFVDKCILRYEKD